jgi:phosphonate transport system permease protein
LTDAADAVVSAFEAERRRLLHRQWIRALLGVGITSVILGLSFHQSQFFDPEIGANPLGRILEFLARMAPHLRTEVLLEGREVDGSLASWFYDLPGWLAALWETIEIAVVATVFGAVAAVFASFLCARNLMPWAPMRFLVRRLLEAIRTVPDLIMALILVAAFGAGATAGVITLTIATLGGLGKLFAEINEEVDPRQLEMLDAAGAGPFSKIRFGVLPQVLLRLEINVAAAAALGIVGAGGIGLELQRAITYTEFSTYLAILLLMVLVIFVIDMTSEAIRHNLLLRAEKS